MFKKSIHVLLLWAKFHRKFLWESVFFSNFCQIKNKTKQQQQQQQIRYLAAILKRYNIWFFFLAELWFFFSAYIYGANFIAKFRWKSVFLGGFHGNPLRHQQEWNEKNCSCKPVQDNIEPLSDWNSQIFINFHIFYTIVKVCKNSKIQN